MRYCHDHSQLPRPIPVEEDLANLAMPAEAALISLAICQQSPNASHLEDLNHGNDQGAHILDGASLSRFGFTTHRGPTD